MKKKLKGNERSEISRHADSGNWDFKLEAETKLYALGKVAVIGEKDVVLVFKSVGAEIFPFTRAGKVKDTIKDLIERNFAVIMITEREAESVNEYLETLRIHTYPIIIPIPNGVELLEYGMGRVQNNIAKAIGSY